MTKVLLDACVPRRLQKGLTSFDVDTAQRVGFDRLADGALLAAIEGRYDVLVTRDRNLIFQQSMTGRAIAIIVLRTADQSPAAFDALLPDLRAALGVIGPGAVMHIGRNAP